LEKNIKNIFTAGLISASLLLVSCGGKTSAPVTTDKDASPLSCVVILATQTPFKQTGDMAEIKGELKAGVDFLNKAIPAELKRSEVKRVIETSEFSSIINEVSGGKRGTIKEVGQKTGCNGVFVTTLSHFRERQGGELAVDSPASAAFEMQLLEADTGRNLCMMNFSETQSSLMENIFSYGKARSRGFKWITVQELAQQGLQEKMMECPYLY